MRQRSEIENEAVYHADKVTPDGSEERHLLALILEVLLDLRERRTRGVETPDGKSVVVEVDDETFQEIRERQPAQPEPFLSEGWGK